LQRSINTALTALLSLGKSVISGLPPEALIDSATDLINSFEVVPAVSETELTTVTASFIIPIGPLMSETETSNPAKIGAFEMVFHSSGV
jgi:hypothetical protein